MSGGGLAPMSCWATFICRRTAESKARLLGKGCRCALLWKSFNVFCNLFAEVLVALLYFCNSCITAGAQPFRIYSVSASASWNATMCFLSLTIEEAPTQRAAPHNEPLTAKTITNFIITISGEWYGGSLCGAAPCVGASSKLRTILSFLKSGPSPEFFDD
jgi:hypothetical protein